MKEENNNKPIAYNGDDNYIFVSYSHQDNDKALPLISELMKEYKVWYDEGIPYSEEWEPFIIARISHASFFLFLASDNSLSSKMCHNEIEFATKENIPFIIIKVKETTRPLNAYFIDKPIFNLNDYDSVES